MTITGALRPITSAVQMTMSFFATVVGHQLGLLLAERVAHLAGIGAGLAGGLLVLDADEGRAERLDLLLRRRPDVGGRDDGAEAAGRGDRLQPGDAGADRRRRRAGGTVPAAVIIIGKPRWNAPPASITAR